MNKKILLFSILFGFILIASSVFAQDTTSPTYSLNSTNSTLAGTPVEHRLRWQDSVGLSGYIFSFDNCTGTLVNDTWTVFSSNPDWSNVTKVINSTVGCTIRWYVYANDTSNNWNSSLIYSLMTTGVYLSISGNLKDKNNNPVPANVIAYTPGTNNIVNSTQTINGQYSLSVLTGTYDIQFNLTGFSISNFFIKLSSVSVTSGIQGLINYITSYGSNKISFTADIKNDQVIQVYSETKPSNASINGTSMTEVFSQSNLARNTWLYNSSERKLHMVVSPALPWLHVDGQWIVDEAGNRVALRGVAGWYNAYVYSIEGTLSKWRPRLEWMKQQGLNAVRLSFRWEDPMFSYEYLDAVIDLFEQYGIYITLTCGYGWDLDQYYNVTRWGESAGPWIENWIITAQRYANRSVIAAYELANEGIVGDAATTRQAFTEGINAVRQYDTRHILIVYEPMWSWGGYSVWTPDTLPSDNNIGFKFGSGWLALRGYALNGSKDHPAYIYYKDKFDLAQAVYGNLVYRCIKYREVMGRPVLAWETGIYDYNASNANYAGLKEGIRLYEEAAIPWNIHWFEESSQYTGTTFQEWFNGLIGTYRNTNQVPLPFDPKPFNLLDYIQAISVYDPYGPGVALITDTWMYITLRGPCSVRVRIFDATGAIEGYHGWADERGLGNFVGDEIITVNAGENRTINTLWGIWRFINPYSAEQ